MPLTAETPDAMRRRGDPLADGAVATLAGQWRDEARLERGERVGRMIERARGGAVTFTIPLTGEGVRRLA